VDKLTEIINYKRKEIEPLLHRADKLKAAALERNEFRGFRSALDLGPDQLSIIAEVKKASPSAGIIDPNFDAMRQAQMYIEGGASCMSILTDENFFQGHLSYLTRIAKESPVPCLRKDFTVDVAQIYEACVAGADAILLIVAALNDEDLKRLFNTAKDLQLDVLVEVHNMPEMERALDIDADLIGINNRNLKTFTTDLATTEQLADECPDDIVLISESGIKSTTDAQRALDAGANGLLIGETLMRANSPAEAIHAFMDVKPSGA